MSGLRGNAAWVTASQVRPLGVVPTTTYSIPFKDGSIKTRDRYSDHPDAHLVAPLSKPLHHFNEEELHDLIHELECDRFMEQEEHIARIVQEVWMHWKGERLEQGVLNHFGSHSRPLQFALPASRAQYVSNPSPATVVNYSTRVTVHIPPSIPEEYVKPLAERMIRDQIEEA